MNENRHCIYATFDLLNEKYYIGYQSQSNRILRDEYWGSPYKDEAKEALSDPDNRFVSILGYFETEEEGYVSETELQTFMDVRNDPKSWNGSNDSFAKGSKAKENLGFITKVVTWFMPGGAKVKRTEVLKESSLKDMQMYINDFNYEYPQQYSTPLEIDNNDIIEEPEDMKELDLNKFLSQARQDCYNRGFKCGSFPNAQKYEKELNVLRIELNGQLDSRIFNLEQELVGLSALLMNTPAASSKYTDRIVVQAKLEHQIKYIKEEVTGDKFYNIIASSFEKGYIEKIDEQQ